LARGKERSKLGPCQGKRDGTEVGIHGGVGGAVSGDDDGIGGPNGNAGGDDGVGWMGQVICIYPYVPLNASRGLGFKIISETYDFYPPIFFQPQYFLIPRHDEVSLSEDRTFQYSIIWFIFEDSNPFIRSDHFSQV